MENTVKNEAVKPVRIGFIGTGRIAQSHMDAYRKLEGVEIVAACDIIHGKAEEFLKKNGIENAKTDYASHLDMLDDKSLALDAVSICTYNRQHAPCATAALEHGVNVLLEKPFAVTLDECLDIMRAEKKSGKLLSIGFQPRFDPNMQMIGKIVRSGELGKIYYIQTGGGRRHGIPDFEDTTFLEDGTAGLGALGDIGCYAIDMVMNALGYPKPLTATGYTASYFGKNPDYYPVHHSHAEKFGVDDFAAGFIRLEGGIILDFRISWAMNMDTPGDTIILGTRGGLRIPSTECWNGSVGGPMTIYRDVCGSPTQTVIPVVPKNEKESNVDRKVKSFVEAVRCGGSAPVPSSQIIVNQAIIDGLNRSAKLGREVDINIPEI